MAAAQLVQLFQHGVNRHCVARFDGFQQRDFNHDFLGGGVAQAKLGVRKNFEDAREGIGVRQRGLFFERGDLGFGDFKQIQIAARNLIDEQVAEMIQQIGKQPAQIFSILRKLVQLRERGLDFAGENGFAQFQNLAFGGKPEHREHIRLLDFVAAEADELIQRGLGVAHPTVSAPRDCVKRGVINLHLLLLGNLHEMLGDERAWNPAQVEPLAARKNRREDFFRIGRREHELHMRGRLLQSFQQRVEGRRRKHVNFVNDVNFELRVGGRVFAGLAKFAHLFDAIVARAVNFQDVQRAALGDFDAARILLVEINFRSAGAVEAFGKDAGDGGLAGAARAAKQVGVRNAVLPDGVGKRLGDVLLPDDLGEPLRAVFSGDDLIRHSFEFLVLNFKLKTA